MLNNYPYIYRQGLGSQKSTKIRMWQPRGEVTRNGRKAQAFSYKVHGLFCERQKCASRHRHAAIKLSIVAKSSIMLSLCTQLGLSRFVLTLRCLE